MSHHPHLATFVAECEDLLGQLEEAALTLVPGAPGAGNESVNLVFRIFHTLKGSAAMVGLTTISSFTHQVESVLVKVRNGEADVSRGLVDLVLGSKDHVAALMATVHGAPPPPAHAEEELLASVADLATARVVAAPVEQAPRFQYRITLQPRTAAGIPRDAVEAVVAELDALGPTTLLGHGEPWVVTVTARATEDEVRDRFIFLETEGVLSLEAERMFGDEHEGVVLFDDLEETVPVPTGPLPPARADVAAPHLPRSPSPAPAPAVPPSVAAPIAASPPGAPAPKATASAPQAPKTGDHKADPVAPKVEGTVRVGYSKLDRLVDLVSELVISRSRLAQVAARLKDPELDGTVEEVERLLVELRDGVLDTRMMAIGGTFSRFKRLVHDLASQLDKDVQLVTEGADTELDKHMLDQLGDPLMHLVRNSVDHGIECPEDRLALGKAKTATVRLTARHAGEHVLVTIEDDGRGLDVDAIRKKGIERGLIPADHAATPAELFRLIFEPGFSTAKAITDVSGRGVGMDVVKRQVEALRGTISIQSERGKGTVISLRLPLTLAIIDGLIVQAAGDRYIVPLSAVTETVELPPGDRERHNHRRAVVVRGDLVPYLSLRDAFGATERPPANEKVVIVQDGDERIGVVVDQVLGKHQTVIQSLGPLCRQVDVTAGATIMGDGRVAMILDLAGLRKLVRQPAPLYA